MKSIFQIILSLLITTNLFSKTTIDTTFSNQWDSRMNQWEHFERTIATYSDEFITSEMTQIYTGDQWMNYHFISYYYNNNLLIEELEQYWNDPRIKWEDSYRKIFSYDIQNKLSQITHQSIYKGIYVNSSREILIYSGDGKLKEKIVQQFEEKWTNFIKYQYYYNADDLLIIENLTEWDASEWSKEVFVMAYDYNEQRNIIEKKKLKNKGTKSTNIIKEEYRYSDEGVIKEYISYVWNSGKKEWNGKKRAWLNSEMDGYVISKADKKRKKQNWVKCLFAENPVDQEMLSAKNYTDIRTFEVYPSKIGGQAIIEFSNPYKELFIVRVRDEKGQFIGSGTTKNEEISINAQNLNKGLYFVEIQGSNLYSGIFSVD